MGVETPPPVALGNGEFRIGAQHGPIDTRMLAGHCSFGSPDASLLVSLLPQFEHVRGEQRPAALVRLVRGLADIRLATAIRGMHERPMHDGTVAELANEAALSRSTFFERYGRTVGVAPMEYLLAWRMAFAKDLLCRHAGGVAEIAERVGYNSTSTFSAAFSRHVGRPPTLYAREQSAASAA